MGSAFGGNPMRPKGNASELERRRCRAFRLMEEGESPSLIARFLDCSRSSIYRWKEQAQSGQEGLAAKAHPPVVRKYLARHPEIITKKFPGYAPELNPDEGVWRHIKYARLPNFAPRDTMHLRRRLHVEFRLLRKKSTLLASFIRKAELPICL